MDFVNEGLESLAEATLFYERYTTLPLQEGVTWYDLRGFTPETVLKIKSVWNEEGNMWLEPGNPGKLDMRWEQATGNPRTFWARGIYYFGIYPKHDSAPSTDGQARVYLRVYFAGIPSRFTNTQAVLSDLPDDHVQALVDYVLYEMYAIDGETQMSLYYWNKYVTRETELARFVDGRVDGARTGSLNENIMSGYSG
jgi:hypothetical protein